MPRSRETSTRQRLTLSLACLALSQPLGMPCENQAGRRTLSQRWPSTSRAAEHEQPLLPSSGRTTGAAT